MLTMTMISEHIDEVPRYTVTVAPGTASIINRSETISLLPDTHYYPKDTTTTMIGNSKQIILHRVDDADNDRVYIYVYIRRYTYIYIYIYDKCRPRAVVGMSYIQTIYELLPLLR